MLLGVFNVINASEIYVRLSDIDLIYFKSVMCEIQLDL